MTDFRNALLDRMIRIYGFEHPLVIQFAESCLAYTALDLSPLWDKILENLVELHEANPYFSNDDLN